MRHAAPLTRLLIYSLLLALPWLALGTPVAGEATAGVGHCATAVDGHRAGGCPQQEGADGCSTVHCAHASAGAAPPQHGTTFHHALTTALAATADRRWSHLTGPPLLKPPRLPLG